MDMTSVPKRQDSDFTEEESDRYEWGYEIDLRDDMIRKLGLSDLAAGQEVMIKAKAKVKSKNERHEEGEEPSISMCLQITELTAGKGSEGKMSENDFASELYGE